MSATTTAVLLPIIAALSTAEQQPQVGKNPQWRAITEKQEAFKQKYMYLRTQLSKLSPEELSSVASTKAEEINAFLKSNGFDITLNPFQEGDFGVASQPMWILRSGKSLKNWAINSIFFNTKRPFYKKSVQILQKM